MTTKENLLNPTVLKILSEKSSWQTIGEGFIRKGCYCQNFHLNHTFIIKLFRFPNNAPPPKPWWDKEHQALHIMNGELSSPRTYGYMNFQSDGFTHIYLFREMVSGSTLEELHYEFLTKTQAIEVGALLAHLHNKGVVTRDCHLANLLLNDQKNICTIDFGNARIYHKKGLVYAFSSARDLKKTQFRCTGLNPTLSKAMEDSYLSIINHNKLSSFLYVVMEKVAALHQAIRSIRRKDKINQTYVD